MTFSLRLLARSRRLRAMGVLAWLMLVINSLAAAPMDMTGVAHSHAMHVTVAAVSEHGHHHVAVHGSRSCCDNHDGGQSGLMDYTCHCAAMCSTTLLPSATVVLTSVAITGSYTMPLARSAPSLNTAPPLRPPAV
jgi:hypothetical protein